MHRDHVIAETRAWLERAVIGLNLCPFAKAVHVKQQVRYVVSEATHIEALQLQLAEELQWLAAADPAHVDTTLLIHPLLLQDFDEFNQFTGVAEETLDALGLDGVLQVASFHPQFQFAGTRPDDIENATNRAPFPTLHLLREDSLDRAVESFPQPEAIYEANIATMQRLGAQGWATLQQQCRDDALAAAPAPPPDDASSAGPAR
ncbi:MAG: DUF1415 domain-containing protein [Burkholderiales bacterium]|nr:DUF1415 domain-containing protein [Burkholderiales bacterium]